MFILIAWDFFIKSLLETTYRSKANKYDSSKRVKIRRKIEPNISHNNI